MFYSTRRFVLSFALYYFVLVFFSPFSIAITSLGEERANPGAFRTFVRFLHVWICRFPLSLGVWEGLRLVDVALPGLFFHLFSLVTFVSPLFVPYFFCLVKACFVIMIFPDYLLLYCARIHSLHVFLCFHMR